MKDLHPLLRAAIALGAGGLASRAVPMTLQCQDEACETKGYTASSRLRLGVGIAVAFAAWLAAPTVITGKPL